MSGCGCLRLTRNIVTTKLGAGVLFYTDCKLVLTPFRWGCKTLSSGACVLQRWCTPMRGQWYSLGAASDNRCKPVSDTRIQTTLKLLETSLEGHLNISNMQRIIENVLCKLNFGWLQQQLFIKNLSWISVNYYFSILWNCEGHFLFRYLVFKGSLITDLLCYCRIEGQQSERACTFVKLDSPVHF